MASSTEAEAISHRLRVVEDAVSLCRVNSGLIYFREGTNRSSPWAKLLDEKDRLFLIELSYAFRRILDYHDGLGLFLSYGANTLFGNLRDGSPIDEIDRHFILEK